MPFPPTRPVDNPADLYKRMPKDLPLYLVELVNRGVGSGKPLLKTVAVGNVDTLLLPDNPNRQALIVNNNDPASPVSLSFRTKAIAGQGIQLNTTLNNLVLWDHDWGQLVKAELHAIATLTGTPPGPAVPFSQIAAQASGAAVADIDSFTVPAGTSGILSGATISNFVGGAPTVQLQLVRGASTVVLQSLTAAGQQTAAIALVAGDVIKWRVTTAVAATTVDVTLSGNTFVLAAAAPANVQVGVLELEG